MALWVCGGENGCGTKYAVGLFRCPRCHNREFYEDGDPMAKIGRLTGPSDKTLPVSEPEPAAEVVDVPAPEPAAVEPLDVTEDLAGPPEPVVEEGGEGSSLGSSSSASTGAQPTSSEPSKPARRKPARTTGSRSGQARTESSSASSTDGAKTDESSAPDTSSE